MAHIWAADRIFETTTTTGTGSIALAGAVTGYQTFDSRLSTSDTCNYVLFGVDANSNPSGEWETGVGTFTSPGTLARTTVEQSSNADSAVSLSAGTKWVMLTGTGTFLDSLAPAAGGTQSIPIMATGMNTRTTSGPASGSTETTTNKIMVETYDFDDTTDEFVQFMFPMPKSWNEGTVTVQFLWSAGATGDVVWGCQGVAISNDDLIDAAFGTAQTVTDSVTATTDLMVSAATAAITIAGTPAAEDLVVFQIYRDADNGADTLTGDAKLVGIRLNITTDAADDA